MPKKATNEIITCRVEVIGGLTAEQTSQKTGFTPYLNQEVVGEIPASVAGQATVELLKFGKRISCYEVNDWQNAPGYRAETFHELLARVTADPTSVDKRPTGTQWKNAKSLWCFVSCRQWHDGERDVSVDQIDRDWLGDWWFGRVRISAQS